MKILYYHQHFILPSQAGGTRSYEMARKLISRGHEVTMVCGGSKNLNLNSSDDLGVYRGEIDRINVIQIRLPYSNRDGLLKRSLTFIKFAFKGIRIAFKEDYDLVFATSTPLTAGIPGIFAKIFKGKKFIFEVRDLWPELPKALGMKNPIFLWGMSLLEWLSYHYADACIGLSPGIVKGIKKRSRKNKRIELVPNGCDLELFVPGSRNELKLKGIRENDTVAVFMGAHGIANGLDAVLDAALVLIEKGIDDIKLVFIGDGKLKGHLMKRKDNEGLKNCVFMDPIPKGELKDIIGKIDVGLMILKDVPAFYYGTSPNKFFDYISAGRPVLNNYPGWLSEIINKNKCGIVVEPGDKEKFADALIMLADNEDLRKTCGSNARICAIKYFDRDKLSDKFSEFIESI